MTAASIDTKWGGLFLAAVIGLSFLISGPARALTRESQMIRGVNAAFNSKGIELIIHLDRPLVYRSQSPATQGKTVQIKLDQLEVTAGRSNPLDSKRQVYPWSGPGAVPVIDVVAEENPVGGVTLTVHFKNTAPFAVKQQGDRRQVSVLIPNGVKAGKSAKASTNQEIERAVTNGKQAITNGDYATAVRMFTKVLGYPENEYSRDARELLGLARQRRGQLAHAKAEYEEYLKRYPDSEGAARVRQRLDTLETAAISPKKPRAMDSIPREGDRRVAKESSRWKANGNLSQYYWLVQLDSDGVGTETLDSRLDTDVFLSAERDGERYRIRTYVSGDYQHDLDSPSGDSGNEFRVSDALAEIYDERAGWFARIGRQSGSRGGVLNRFDGVDLGYEVRPKWTLHLRTGFPVDFARNHRINQDEPFVGLSLDIGSFAEHWDGELYAIRQTVDGTENRSAVGVEIRYADGNRSLLSVADYDVSYGVLNSLFAIGSWMTNGGTAFNAQLNYRKSPFLVTRNALIGQTDRDLGDLVDRIGESAAKRLAEDRTADLTMGMISVTHPLSADWTIGGDVTVSEYSSTPPSGGVPGTPSVGPDFDYGVYLTRLGWLVERSYSSIGVRYRDGSDDQRLLLDLNGRYPLIDRLRLGPRFRIERRSVSTGSDQLSLRPGVRFDYRIGARLDLELDFSVDWLTGRDKAFGGDEIQYFLTTGIHYNF